MGFTDNVISILKRDEGFEPKPYRDSAKELGFEGRQGHLTIGYGCNLEEGITSAEGEMLLANRFQASLGDLRKAYPLLTNLDDVRFGVLGMMVYNLGIHRFAKFKKVIAACYAKDFETAAAEMLDSEWAKQVGARADRLSEMMRNGQWLSVTSTT